MRQNAFAEWPAIRELIQQAIDKTRPRQAFVTHRKEGKVRVRIGDDAPGFTWYPCSVAGVQVGDQVSLFPLFGGGFLAVPVEWGWKKIALGFASFVSPASINAMVIGRAARAQNASGQAMAIGDYASVDGSPGGQALGWNTNVLNSQTAIAMGYDADVAGSWDGMAIGSESRVSTGSQRSIALGKGASVPASTPDTAVIATKRMELKPAGAAGTLASELVLYDAAGTAVLVNASALSRNETRFKALVSSGSASTTLVAASATDTGNMAVITSDTLAALIPAITTGTWRVMVSMVLTASRNVATGGITLRAEIGSGGAGTLPRPTASISQAITGAVAFEANGVAPSTLIQTYFSGQGTAGTTTRFSYTVTVTATRE